MECHFCSGYLTSVERHSEKAGGNVQRACTANFCINYASGHHDDSSDDDDDDDAAASINSKHHACICQAAVSRHPRVIRCNRWASQ